MHMTFSTLHQALRATRKFHREYGSRGYTYRADFGWQNTDRRTFYVGVYSANGTFLTLV